MEDTALLTIQAPHRVALMILSLILVAIVLELVRRESLKEKYALLWLATSGIGVVIGIFPQILVWITTTLRFQLLTTLYAISFVYVLAIILVFSVIISRLSERNRNLAQEIAILSNRITHLESDHD
jgi:hypothetical protein